MDFGRLGRGDIVAAAGGLLLFISMWLPWFSVDALPPQSENLCGANEESCTGFETFSLFSALIIPGMDFLLVGAALAPWILVWIVIRGHTLSWPPGEVTMIVGAIASTLILYNGDRRPGGRHPAVREPRHRVVPRAARRTHDRGRRSDQPGHARRRHAQASGHVLAPPRSSRNLPAGMDRDTSLIAHDLRDTSAPDRNLALELVRVTESAALAAARWVGRGDKESADQAAVDAMRFTLHAVPMDGNVVIGEGEKDEAPMLYNGEQIGDGSPPEVDVAVDPLEGTRLTARGMPSALAVVALAERGTHVRPGPLRLHGEDGGRRPTSPTCSTSTGRSARRSSWSPSGAGPTSATWS